MTPFEERGWNKDTRFLVDPNFDCATKGKTVRLWEDDRSNCPRFILVGTDELNASNDEWDYLPLDHLIPLNNKFKLSESAKMLIAYTLFGLITGIVIGYFL